MTVSICNWDLNSNSGKEVIGALEKVPISR